MLSADLHLAAAAAGGAFLVDAPLEARADALPRHLDQAEGAGAEDLRAGPVALHRVAQRPLDVAAMAVLAHVDEVVHHHAAQVAEPQLAGDFLGGDLVELVGRLLGRAVGAEVAAVDVDRHEGLGLVDHQRPAAAQRHLALIDLRDLLVEIVLLEQRLLAFVDAAAGSRTAA